MRLLNQGYIDSQLFWKTKGIAILLAHLDGAT
jgi:hypothetical protein